MKKLFKWLAEIRFVTPIIVEEVFVPMRARVLIPVFKK